MAGNPSTPPSTLSRLARDRDTDVRIALASNQHCPPELLSQLVDIAHTINTALGPADKISRYTVKSDDGWTDIMRHTDAIPTQVASNPSCPPGLLSQLSQHPQWYTRAAASNQNAQPAPLKQAAQEQAARVRYAAAGNPNAPSDLFQ